MRAIPVLLSSRESKSFR